jgi:putative membrane protein
MKKQIWITLALAITALGSFALTALAEQGMARADKKFVVEAASGGMMEVHLGQVAKTNAQSPEVKSFGERMVTDHSKANDELKALAQLKGLTLPADMEKKHKADIEKLSKVTGANFDRMYMEMMVKDHVKDVAQFRKESQKAKDPDLKAWAGKALPVLEQHLQLAKETAQKLGIKSK